jgi:DNA replication protein DnaC
MRQSGLSEAIDTQTFETFITRTETQKKIKEAGLKYLDNLFADKNNPRRPWFYVGGNPGSGKTHICTAICGEILKRNIGVRYMQWLDVSRRLKANVNDEDFEDEVADYINVSVLYIDDLLKQKYTENPIFTEADIKIAFTILNARYLMNKPTIISSEWDLVNQLLPADEGVFSRVYERCKGNRLTIERKMENNYRLTA